ncbi:MAG: FadR family transcriptional regulator [Pseudomonadales bacterium]|nr:FadR family transcriptional regulator [Pseudomonadales bacterium]
MNQNNRSRVEEITSVLTEEILHGQYRPGERLPSERDLAARFEVNRGAVREALKKLEQLGIATIKPGGVRVVPVEEATLEVLGHMMDLDDLPNPDLVEQLFEVLGAMMALSARSAIEKATDEQIGHLRTIIGRLIHGNLDQAARQQNWKELGDYFTEINRNLVLRLIGNGLKLQFVGRLEKIGVLVKLDPDENLKILRRMDAAMEQRNQRDLSDAIITHFTLIKESILKALNEKEDATLRSALNA